MFYIYIHICLWFNATYFDVCQGEHHQLDLPDDVSRGDLYGPGAPQVIVVGKGIPGGEDSSCGLTLKPAAAFR